jgi:hypothetical protein
MFQQMGLALSARSNAKELLTTFAAHGKNEVLTDEHIDLTDLQASILVVDEV